MLLGTIYICTQLTLTMDPDIEKSTFFQRYREHAEARDKRGSLDTTLCDTVCQ
jgi:hypothetical protein